MNISSIGINNNYQGYQLFKDATVSVGESPGLQSTSDTLELSAQANNTVQKPKSLGEWMCDMKTAGIGRIIDNYKFNSSKEQKYMEKALTDIVRSFQFDLSGGTASWLAVSEEEIGLAAGLAAAKAELYAGQARDAGYGDSFGSTLKQAASDMINEYIGTIKSAMNYQLEMNERYKDNPRYVDKSGWYPELDDDLINDIIQRTKEALLADDGGESFDRLLNEMHEQYNSKANRENVLRDIVYHTRKGSTSSSVLENIYGKAAKDDWEQFLAEKMADSQSVLGKMLALTREMILREISSFIAKHNMSDFEAAVLARDIHNQNWLQSVSSELTASEAEKVADAVKNNTPPTMQDFSAARASAGSRGPRRYDLAGTAESEFKWGKYKELINSDWNETNASLQTGREYKNFFGIRVAMFANA